MGFRRGDSGNGYDRVGHGHGLRAMVAAIILAAALAPTPSRAATKTSTGTANWNTAGTWSPSGVPGAADSVVIATGHNVTLDTDGTCGVLNVVGTLTFDATAGRNLTITTSSGMTGNLRVSGTLDYGNNGSGGSQYLTILGSLYSTGSLANGNTVIGYITFTGTGSQTISNTDNFGGVTVNSSSLTLTAGSNLAVRGSLTVSAGTLVLGSYTATHDPTGGVPGSHNVTVYNGATLRIGGTGTFPSGYDSHSLGATSTVEYNGTNQTVTDEDYGHLTLSGSGTKTMPGTAVSIAGNVTLSGTPTVTAGSALTVGGNVNVGTGCTFGGGSYSHSVAGGFTNDGSFTAGSSTITFDGGSAQTLGGASSTTFNNLALNNTSGLSLTAGATVSAALTLTSGRITLGASNLTIGPSGSISGASSSNYVVTNSTGTLVRQSVGTAAVTYPIGTSSAYLPATVKIASGTADFSWRVTGSVTPSLGNDETAVKRTWVLGRSAGTGDPSEISLQWNAGDEGSSFTRASAEPFRYSTASWVDTGAATLSGSGPYVATITGLSATGSYILAMGYAISGRVFDDVNYGGGAGRNWTAASADGGSARASARVELFDGGGNYLTDATTDGSGDYSFSGLSAASYRVRVVGASVTSSRTGYTSSCLPVMTFRTDASTGTAADVTDHVGGQAPATTDAGNAGSGWILNGATGAFSGGGSGTAHAFAPVTISAADVAGVDFGFNFNTIINTNDDGAGSLRQFLTSANLLSNTGLAQSGRTAGVDNAVFMLADGTARAGMNTGYASQFTDGVATFQPASALPAITDPVTLDGQTQPGWASDPILELSGASAGSNAHGFDITAGSSTVRGFTINIFTGTDKGGIRLATAGGNTVQSCWIGTDKTGAATAGNTQGVRIEGSTGNTIGGTAAGVGNVIAGNTGVGVLVGAGIGHAIEGNAIHSNRGIGIDLGGNGVTANDGTKDGGLPNSGMDFPVLTAAYLFGTTLSFSGYVGSAAGQGTFASARVELFKSDNDATGHGEGSSYLGTVTADANGNFSGTLAVSGLAAGDRIAATATDGSGNTSEFGANATIGTLAVVKRTFDANGDAVASGSTGAKGAVFRFLLYVDNRGGAATDVRLSDVLDPTFEYVAGSLKAADVTTNCATTTCTAGEEASILSDALAGTALTDAVDGDAGAVTGTTIQIGRANAGNGQLDIAANKVYAVTFQVRMR